MEFIILLYSSLLVFKVVAGKTQNQVKKNSEGNETWIFQPDITPVLCQYAL